MNIEFSSNKSFILLKQKLLNKIPYPIIEDNKKKKDKTNIKKLVIYFVSKRNIYPNKKLNLIILE